MFRRAAPLPHVVALGEAFARARQEASVPAASGLGAPPPSAGGAPHALTMGEMAELRDSCSAIGWDFVCGPVGGAVSECRCCAPEGQQCSTVWTAERGTRWKRTGNDALPWLDTYAAGPYGGAFSSRPDYEMYASAPGMSPLFDLDGQVKWDWLLRQRPGLVAKYGPQMSVAPEAGRLPAIVDWLVRAGDVDAATASRIISGWDVAPGMQGSSGLGLGRALPAGAIGLPPPQVTPQGTVRAWDYQGVEFTIDTMRRLVRDSLVKEQSMAIRRLAERIIAGVYAKDYLSEVAAIYYWVLVNLRYVRDPAHIELVQSPLQVLQPTPQDRAAGRSAAQEDCETQATTLAALCMSIGNSAEFVTISTQRGVGYHHVFCVVRLPDGQKLVLDPVPGAEVTPMLRSVVAHQAWPVEPVRVPGRSGFIASVSGNDAGRWGRSLDVAGLGTEWNVADGPAYTGYGPAFDGIMGAAAP